MFEFFSGERCHERYVSEREAEVAHKSASLDTSYEIELTYMIQAADRGKTAVANPSQTHGHLTGQHDETDLSSLNVWDQLFGSTLK